MFSLFSQNFTALLKRARDVFIASKIQPERNRPLLCHKRTLRVASECKSLHCKFHSTIRFLGHFFSLNEKNRGDEHCVNQCVAENFKLRII